MDFDFSEEQKLLGREARRLLETEASSRRVRAVVDGPEPFDRELWRQIAEFGFTGAAIPASCGGVGAGYLELCVLAEELGRVLAPIPFASSAYLAAEFIKLAGDADQREAWLPRLASGEAIGAFAQADETDGATVTANGRLTGVKTVVLGGDVADFAIVSAREGSGASLFIAELHQPGVATSTIETLDPTLSHGRIVFQDAAAVRLGEAGEAPGLITQVMDRAAVLVAFEQLGGADRALEMARDYAQQRMAFGRPIGSFQAIKHMLADMYVAATLARANCYWAAWALATDAAELPLAAASARVSATQAYELCARNSLHVHGGMGFTWEVDCHLHLRRAHLLKLALGGLSGWEGRLVRLLDDAA